jgi:hypothetical protein
MPIMPYIGGANPSPRAGAVHDGRRHESVSCVCAARGRHGQAADIGSWAVAYSESSERGDGASCPLITAAAPGGAAEPRGGARAPH